MSGDGQGTWGTGKTPLRLPCPRCWKPFEPDQDFRLQRCPSCGALSYFHPGERDGFLRYVEGYGADVEEIHAMRRQEQAAVHEMNSLERDLVEHRRQREAETARGRGTRRLLSLTLLILAFAATVLLMGPEAIRSDYLALTILFSLVSLVFMLFIVLGANQRAIVFQQSLLEEEVRRGRDKLAAMKKKIDLAITGTTALRGRPD